MSHGSECQRLLAHIRELATLPQETEWVEFKENNEDPEVIGEYLSALANAAALQGKSHAYLVWGVMGALSRRLRRASVREQGNRREIRDS